MNINSLKRHFLATFPVLAPHDRIEAELMLYGNKPSAVIRTFAESANSNDQTVIRTNNTMKALDQAVKDGQLVSRDLKPKKPNDTFIFRYYAKSDQADKLDLLTDFRKQASSKEGDPQRVIEEMTGTYLGYRKRDVWLNDALHSWIKNRTIKTAIQQWSRTCQKALQETLLLEMGYDLEKWRDNYPEIIPPSQK